MHSACQNGCQYESQSVLMANTIAEIEADRCNLKREIKDMKEAALRSSSEHGTSEAKPND
jgi:hypothetical protein